MKTSNVYFKLIQNIWLTSSENLTIFRKFFHQKLPLSEQVSSEPQLLHLRWQDWIATILFSQIGQIGISFFCSFFIFNYYTISDFNFFAQG
jgi:hypothetical protein